MGFPRNFVLPKEMELKHLYKAPDLTGLVLVKSLRLGIWRKKPSTKQKDMGGIQEGDTSLWIFCFLENILRMPVLFCHFSRHKRCILEVKGSTIVLHFFQCWWDWNTFFRPEIHTHLHQKTSHSQNESLA